jgi:hypothetical protein
MTTEPSAVSHPKHPTHALTTYELRDYRRELEHAIDTLPGHAVTRNQLRQRLADVLAEQQARTQLHQASRS